MVRYPDRDRLILHLKRRGISTGVHFMPLPLHPLYSTYDKGIENSKRIWTELVTLPLFPELTSSEVDYIIEALQDFEKGLLS